MGKLTKKQKIIVIIGLIVVSLVILVVGMKLSAKPKGGVASQSSKKVTESTNKSTNESNSQPKVEVSSDVDIKTLDKITINEGTKTSTGTIITKEYKTFGDKQALPTFSIILNDDDSFGRLDIVVTNAVFNKVSSGTPVEVTYRVTKEGLFVLESLRAN